MLENKEDKKLLLSFIPSDELAATEKMNNLFKNIKKDAKEGNDEMVDALNEAFDDETKNWLENKKFGGEIGFKIDSPKVS